MDKGHIGLVYTHLRTIHIALGNIMEVIEQSVLDDAPAPEQTELNFTDPGPAPAPAPSTPGYTIEDLRALASKLIERGERSKVLEVLQSVGAANLTVLSEEKYNEVANALERLL